jgi:methionine-rich copper-binding protein CopC
VLTLGGAAACAEPGVELTPADGATLETAPASVSLTLPVGGPAQQLHLTVVDGDGTELTAGPPELRGAVASVDVDIAAPGSYTVVYHVVLADGEQHSGVATFQVGTSGAQAQAPTVAGHDHGAQSPFDVALVVFGSILAVGTMVWLLWQNRPRRRYP